MKRLFAAAALCIPLAAPADASRPAGPGTADREWAFRVLLDGAEIGRHDFELETLDDRQRLYSEARFDVKFLFFTAYRYRHRNVEEWSGDCLLELDARTETNGRTRTVAGERSAGRFVVERDGERAELPACVMSFAYWNPDFLDAERLLNPQTGEFVEVEVAPVAEEVIEVRGEPQAAQRYRLTAKDLQLDLWYSQDDEWLGLQSLAKGGRVLRYERI